MVSSAVVTVLAEPEWRAMAAAHEARIDQWAEPHRDRRSRGETHPVHDFLFPYYSQAPGRLRRWHPGAGTALAPSNDGPAPHAAWRWYRADDDVVFLDRASYLADRGTTVCI